MIAGFQVISIALVPVYLFILGGFIFRKIGWLNQRSDESLLKLQINVFYPALIFSYIFRNEALKSPELLIFPPLVGFLTITLGFGVAFVVAKLIGLQQGKGLRTFAFTSGIYNYGFIPIPLIDALYHSQSTTGTLMVHNMGIELAIWTVGILLLSGNFGSGAWKKLFNPPVIALLAGLLLNFLVPGQGNLKPNSFFAQFLDGIFSTLQQLGRCAIPIALILVGASIRDLIGDEKLKFDWKVVTYGCGVRLFLLPILFLTAAVLLPLPHELKIVMLIQAAMPSGMFPIIMAKHYGGSPHTAVQVVISTTFLSIITIPIWVTIGQHFVG